MCAESTVMDKDNPSRHASSERRWGMRRVTGEDLPKVADFAGLSDGADSSGLSQASRLGRYQWEYLTCPGGPAEVWLAEDGGSVVGTTAMVTKRMRVGGETTPVAELGDVLTHPAYRGQGIFSTLLRKCTEETLKRGVRLIYGTPNDKALPIEEHCGFQVVSSVDVVKMVRPLNVRKVVRAVAKSRLLAAVGSPVLDSVYGVLFGRRRSRTCGLSIEDVESFPGDIESLWRTCCQHYDVIMCRDRSYLEWRYVACPNEYRILVARDGGTVVGYMVTGLRSRDNLQLGCIADYLVVDEDPRVFKALLAEAFSGFVDRRVDMVYSWTVRSSRYCKALGRAGFLGYRRQPVICYLNEVGGRVVGHRLNWHFTVGDSDNI